MVFILFVLLYFTAALFLVRFGKKNLHALEILSYWLVSTILFQNYSAWFFMNFQFAVIPNVPSLEMVNFINRTVLYPILGVTFLNQYVILSSTGKRLRIIFGYMALLNGMEWLEDRLGVYKHTYWKFWWSLTFWLAFLLILIGFMKIFRKKLLKRR